MPASRPAGATRLALCVGDAALRSRIAAACAAEGLPLAESASRGSTGADVVIADAPVETAAPVIALTPDTSGWRCDVRAAIPPDIDPATLGAVIAVVAAGLVVVPRQRSELGAKLPANARGAWVGMPASTDADDPPLTPREREVLALLAAGASNKEIARTLSVSVHTAKFHVASIIEKLGASGRLEAVSIGIRSGLIMI